MASYLHVYECSGRFTVLECTVICGGFFFVESCLFSVKLSCVCYHVVANVMETCGPSPLLYYEEQLP